MMMKKFVATCLIYLCYLPSVNAVSVHDPSIVKSGNTYYVFGSHLAAARSTDLVNWTRFAEGVNSNNPLFRDVTRELADGKFYMYYNACRGDSPLSAQGVAVADRIEGPYTNKQVLLRRAVARRQRELISMAACIPTSLIPMCSSIKTIVCGWLTVHIPVVFLSWNLIQRPD